MTLNVKALLAIIFSIITVVSFGQQSKQNNEAPDQRKWGIEVNVLWPIFPGNLYRVQATRILWQKNKLRGDLILGGNTIISDKREEEGTFSDYSLVTGYRQYFGKGLHLELTQQTGFGNLKNHVTTGKEYNSFDYGMQLLAGYKFNIPRSRFYTAVQMGLGRTIYQSDPWPIYEDETLEKVVGNETIFVGGVLVGIRF